LLKNQLVLIKNIKLQTRNYYRKTSISPPWRSVFQPFVYSGVLVEVTFNSSVALYFSTSWSEF